MPCDGRAHGHITMGRTLENMKRVVILGRGASGKSTLARRLGEITGLPVIELDKLFWRPGLVATPRDQWVVVQEKLSGKMDGSWMVTWVPTMLSRFGFERRTRSFFWTSHSSAALGEQSGDRTSVPTSGVGSWRIAVKVVRF
jgi:hypothetical protein